MGNLNIFLENENLIDMALKEVKINYRPYDPGNYLYREICKEKDINRKFEDKFIELIYVTLSAWNMNSRGAKLSDFEDFKDSLKINKNQVLNLSKYRMEKIQEIEFEMLTKILEHLFNNLKLVGKNKNNNEKPRLVTFSKTMHFLLPDLIMPIDRKYTLKFFYNNVSINPKLNLQFQKFLHIFKECSNFALKSKLNLKLDDNWNQNVPKIIDNIIIGYSKINNNKK